MEFLKVIVPGREDEEIDVLINGEVNGMAGEVLMLGEGFVVVSVNVPGAEEKEVYLQDTTANHPMVVEIAA